MKANYGLYSKKIIQHFLHPKNQGVIKNYDGLGKVGNLMCGDVLWLYIKVKKDKKTGKEKISKISFQTFGCVVALAVSSMITEMAKGKTLDEALRITKDDILKKTGKLPIIKIHCSVLVTDALHESIYNYLSKTKQPIPEELQKEHERIQHDLKVIEERHKEFVKLEERVFEK